MDKELEKLRQQQKADLLHPKEGDEFLQEAAEGWQAAGVDGMDAILGRIDRRVDEKAAATTKTQPAKVVEMKGNRWAIWLIGLAASLMLVVMAVYFFNQKEKPLSAEQLYAMYYKPLQAPEPVFRGEANSKTPQMAQKASEVYGEGLYDQAVAFYKALLKEYPQHPKYTLFLGLSFLQQEKYDEAISVFDNHVPSGTTYDEDIQWYLALAHLRKGNLNTARTMLEKFRESPGSYYKANAGQIIARMPVR